MADIEDAGPTPRRIAAVGAAFGLLLFGNELICNLVAFRERLGQAKVVGSITDNDALMLPALTSLAGMLAWTLLFSLVVGCAWGWVSLVLFRRARPLTARLPCGRLLFWWATGFAFFHTWYSLHHVVLPDSRLWSSPLFMATGALRRPLPLEPGRWALTLALAPAVLAMTVTALRSSRPLRRSLLGAAAALAVALPVYERATGPGAPTRFGGQGHVVLLGLDSFQLNRLPLGGATHDLAPHTDGFLREAHLFANGWTPFARTYPSWTTILSGRLPPRHGVRFNLMPDEALADDNRWLADELRDAGYATFHASDEVRFSIIRPRHGFDEQFHPRMGIEDFVIGSFFDFSTANLARQSALGHDLFPAIADNRASVSYNGRLWVRNLIRRLDALPTDRPLFLAIHLCGDHWPFSTPFPWSLSSEDLVERSIAMVDDQVGTLLDWLDASGLRERGHVWMLSDHGDGYSGDPEDETNSHGDDFRSLHANKAIMAVQGPGIAPGVEHAMVRIHDIYPTVLELAGLPDPGDAIDGRSLAPSLAGEPLAHRPVFAETGLVRTAWTVARLVEQNARHYAFDPDSGLMHLKPSSVTEFLAHKSYMLIDGEHRLVVHPSSKRFRLWAFDPATGLDAPGEPDAGPAERERLLDDLARQYGLDHRALLEVARQRGFLPPTAGDLARSGGTEAAPAR